MTSKYYQKSKEMLQRKECENYQNLPEEEKNKKRKNARNRYRKLSIENEFREAKK